MDLYLPALPAIGRALGNASDGSVQLTLTGCMIGLAMGQLGAGPLSDRLGRRLPQLVGLVGYVLASALCAAAPALWFLVALRILQGLSGSAGLVISMAIVRDITPTEQLARVFSMLVLVMGLAPVSPMGPNRTRRARHALREPSA